MNNDRVFILWLLYILFVNLQLIYSDTSATASFPSTTTTVTSTTAKTTTTAPTTTTTTPTTTTNPPTSTTPTTTRNPPTSTTPTTTTNPPTSTTPTTTTNSPTSTTPTTTTNSPTSTTTTQTSTTTTPTTTTFTPTASTTTQATTATSPTTTTTTPTTTTTTQTTTINSPTSTTTTPTTATTTPTTATITPTTTTFTPTASTTTQTTATTTPTSTTTTPTASTTTQTTTTTTPTTTTFTPTASTTTQTTTTTTPTTATTTPTASTTSQTTTTTTPTTTTFTPTASTTTQTTTATTPTTTTFTPTANTTQTTTTATPTTTTTTPTTITITPTTATTTTSPVAYNYCSDLPCKNGGTCNNIGTTYNCSCAGGYTNYSCEIEINECDHLPCYPFGDCVDKINNYSCICRPGFESVSVQNCKEINECDQYRQDHPSEAVCLNNGTCIDIINGFYCECRQIYEDLIIFGDRCDQSVSRYNTSSFTGISMPKGIQAGGSALTVNGKGVNIIPPIGVYFNGSGSWLGVLFGYLKDGSVQSTQFIVLTPKAPNDSYVEVPLTISVLLSGGTIKFLPGSVTFQYVGNPSITDIEPKTQLASGGIKLTVIGSNLDAVGTPQMKATLMKNTAQNETGRTITYPPQTCFGANGDQMTCQMPKFSLSDSSDDATTTPDPSAISRSNSPNKKPISTFTINNKTYDLYLKFTLDSYPKYEDLSKSLPNITFTLVDSRPGFPSGANEKQQNFDLSLNEPLTIAGKHLSLGVSKADYSVAVGAGSCNILNLTDNFITCSAPVDRPEQGNDSIIYCSGYSDYMAVMVTAVGDKYFAYCITYTSGDHEEIFLIMGLCVGVAGSMLLLITMIVCVVIARRRRRYKQPASGSTIYPPDWRPLPGQVPLHSYGDASKSNNYLNDYVISGYENNIQSDSTANAAGALYPCGIDATEASSQPSNRRALNAKPFGYIVRPGKRISWTRPTKEESMRELSQRQSKDQERYLHGLPKFALGRPSSNDLAHNNTSDYTNMQNVPSGSRNILQEINEAVELDDTEYNRYTSETNNRTEIKRRNLPSYYPPINDSKDDGLRRQPGRSEYPTTMNQKSTEEM